MATVVETLRRVYHDIVLRRATVRVIAAEPCVTVTQPPIFLVGTYRSGTTLLRYVLDSHSRICCPPESDFIAPLRALIDDGKPQVGLRDMGFDTEHVTRKLRELCAYFFNNYAASLGKERWADKSPAYIDHLDVLRQLFPEARFVMLFRHGLDQVHSFTRGGAFRRPEIEPFLREGEDIRVGGIRYWRTQVEKQSKFMDIHPDCCMALRYEDICTSPEARLREMFTFLGEPWESKVLEFYRLPHDKGKEDGRAAATRGFTVSANHYRQWPADLIEACSHEAQPTLKNLGYSV